jgi:hypothetical protein
MAVLEAFKEQTLENKIRLNFRIRVTAKITYFYYVWTEKTSASTLEDLEEYARILSILSDRGRGQTRQNTI